MNNHRRHSARLLAAAATLLLILAPATWAQEEEEQDEGIGTFYAELGMWVAQATGLEFQAATLQSASSPFDTQVIGPSRGTSAEIRYRVGYELPKKFGSIVLTSFAHSDLDLHLTELRPGDFAIGETLAHPLFAGFGNDGLADGLDYSASNHLRDLRIDFYRDAFVSARTRGKWFVGVRRVSHSRAQRAEYYALVPVFPPLIPPLLNTARPDLVPRSDLATMRSDYDGRGLEAGFELMLPMWKDKLTVETGFAVAAMRGNVSTSYTSTTHAYTIQLPEDEAPSILYAPYDEFGQTRTDPMDPTSTQAYIDYIQQQNFFIGLNDSSGRELSSTVLETWLGFRWKFWREFELLGGFRMSQYSDVGVDLRPVQSATLAGINLQDVTETHRSATYEGFYGAVAVHF